MNVKQSSHLAAEPSRVEPVSDSLGVLACGCCQTLWIDIGLAVDWLVSLLSHSKVHQHLRSRTSYVHLLAGPLDACKGVC